MNAPRLTIWQRAAAAHEAAIALVRMHLATCATCREPNSASQCAELRELSLTLLSTSKFPAGADVIRAGECPVGGAGPMACFFCSYGHMTECHYPQSCAEARCGHYREDAA